jgi:hypothetical protein
MGMDAAFPWHRPIRPIACHSSAPDPAKEPAMHKTPHLPTEKRKELIGALLDRFLPRTPPRPAKQAQSS